MSKKYCYRFDICSPIGKKFRSLWNECNKAQRAAETFRKKVGACGFCPNEAMFAGGIEGLYFEDDKKVSRKIWREDGKAEDGTICWLPICKKREDVMILPRKDFRPSNTATRIYGKRVLPWGMVRHQHTLQEWAAMVEMTLVDDKENYAEALDERMKGEFFVKFVELYRDDDDAFATDKRWNLSWTARESIRIERDRLLLPVVDVQRFYSLLHADLLDGKGDDGRMHFVKPVTPMFFEYGNRYYFGSPYPCNEEGLEQMDESDYMQKLIVMRQMERDMKALKEVEKGE